MVFFFRCLLYPSAINIVPSKRCMWSFDLEMEIITMHRNHLQLLNKVFEDNLEYVSLVQFVWSLYTILCHMFIQFNFELPDWCYYWLAKKCITIWNIILLNSKVHVPLNVKVRNHVIWNTIAHTTNIVTHGTPPSVTALWWYVRLERFGTPRSTLVTEFQRYSVNLVWTECGFKIAYFHLCIKYCNSAYLRMGENYTNYTVT